MPDATIINASERLLDVGLVGVFLVFSLAALSWVIRQWMKTLRELYEEKDERLKDAKESAQISESVRNAMVANTNAIQAVLGILK